MDRQKYLNKDGMKNMRLKDKVAFISGGARGMGAAEGRIFAQEGAKVALGDLRDELGREVAREICEAGGEAIFVHLDVASEESWQKAIAATVERFGKLDISRPTTQASRRPAGCWRPPWKRGIE